jgi:hypothetical protein
MSSGCGFQRLLCSGEWRCPSLVALLLSLLGESTDSDVGIAIRGV